MNKSIKSVIAALICGFVFLTGCGVSSTSLPSNLIAKANGYPETLNIISSTFFWSGNDENAENAKKLWQDEMSERYGVKITVFSNSVVDGKQIMSAGKKVVNIFEGNEKFSGLIQTQSINGLQDAINADLAVPLDDYLAENKIWNALPNEVKSTFKVNGHIYAIPSFLSDSLGARFIYKDAIEQTGIDVTDLDSLKEFATKYTQMTKNYSISSYATSNLRDILSAFGLYNNGASSPFCYDPTEDCFVDFLTKGAAVDALEYLREINASGALNCDFKNLNEIYDNFDNHKSASLYNYYTSDTKLENYSEVLTLNPDNPQVLQNNVYGFYMTKDTAQPKETINFFVNMLFGSEQNYLECWLGSSDGYVLNSEGTITVNMVQNSDGSYIVPAAPNLTGGFTDVFPYSDADILYSQDGVITKDSKTKAGEKNREYEVLKNALEKGIVVKIPPAYSMINSTTYFANQQDIRALYDQCIKDAITATNWTVQQIVDDYKKEMLNMGGNKMLDEMNAAIGKKTVYYYG